MPQHLPYRVTTATGTVLDIEFPLHAETVSAVRVGQLLSATLTQIDHELEILDDTANGDVLQAGHGSRGAGGDDRRTAPHH